MAATEGAGRDHRRAGPGPALLVVSFVLLVAAWVVTNPVGAAPDETDHYLRVLAVGRGDFVGRPLPAGPAVATPKSCCEPDNATARYSETALSRLVEVPAGLAPAGFNCYAFVSAKSAECLDRRPPPPPTPTDQPTRMGTVPVAPYVVPGLATRLTGDGATALLLARAANAVLALSFLALAATLLWSPASPLSLVGLMLAVTPTVLFVSSTVSNSAAEISGAICLLAALLHLVRPGPRSRWAWPAVGVGGLALASSRSLGPAWVVLAFVTVVGVAGGATVWERFKAGGRSARLAVAAVVLGTAATVAWELRRPTNIDFDLSFFLTQLPRALPDIPRVAREIVGRFGWVDTPMPVLAFLAWSGATMAAVGLALVTADRRRRAMIVLLVVASGVVTVVVSAGLLRQNGFYVNGRHVLAFVVAVPLLAGEVLLANRDRLGRWQRHMAVTVAAVVASVQGVALYANARRYAVGTDGPLAFFGSSRWEPAGGWWAWSAVVVAAMACTVASPAVAATTAGGRWARQGAVAREGLVR